MLIRSFYCREHGCSACSACRFVGRSRALSGVHRQNGLRDARSHLVRMAHSRNRILPFPQPLWLLDEMRQWLLQRLGWLAIRRRRRVRGGAAACTRNANGGECEKVGWWFG